MVITSLSHALSKAFILAIFILSKYGVVPDTTSNAKLIKYARSVRELYYIYRKT